MDSTSIFCLQRLPTSFSSLDWFLNSLSFCPTWSPLFWVQQELATDYPRDAQSVERATPGEKVLGSIFAVAARSLLVGSVSV